jgi:uncharacterized protein (DUF1778 family)
MFMATVLKKMTTRSQRINFRASAREERLIRLGAEKRGEKVTRFIIESACSAAEIVLANDKHFELAPAKFTRFTEALERPAKASTALQKLFAEKSVIERESNQATSFSSRTAGV